MAIGGWIVRGPVAAVSRHVGEFQAFAPDIVREALVGLV